jgi:hypothetical protein
MIGFARGDKARTVFIPAEHAHPHGYFFHVLAERPSRLRALFVAFYGKRNPRARAHCINSYTRTVTSAREHVLFPFHECISLSWYASSCCANCIWHEDATCSWSQWRDYLLEAPSTASEESVLTGFARLTTRLSPASRNPPDNLAPSQSPQLFSLNL